MTTWAGPYDTANMLQLQWEETESKLWKDGVISGARNQFATTTTTGLGISVASGDAMLDGFRFYADAATALTATTADPSLPRIDLVVLRIDEAAHTAAIAIKAGTPASSPVAPNPTKTPGGTYELGIYQLRVNAGATTIASLTDVRTYAAPTNALPATGGTSTGKQTVSLALGGALTEFARFTATDGKIYALCINTDGTFLVRNITDGVNVFILGPTADALQTGSNKTVWHSGNDGAGSGLDADTVDGVQASAFAQLAALANFTAGLQTGGKNVCFAQAGLTGKRTASTTAPASPADGDEWIDLSTVLS